MKAMVIYYSPTGSGHGYQALTVNDVFGGYVRSEVLESKDLIEALYNAKPRVGETVLNSVAAPNS